MIFEELRLREVLRHLTMSRDSLGEGRHIAPPSNTLPERGRTSDLYVAKDVLAKKADFLREKSKPLEIDFGNGLVLRLVFDATQPHLRVSLTTMM